ncbi:hypothetical protein [uncultured Alistipes sp.]|uniref:hypothetical protein n=1 Tax=uncultured Alistipes sp. TaxID=538949 RepID=UPI00265FA61C|nr:hypothetical protein [uncultured Alistipes sp.]
MNQLLTPCIVQTIIICCTIIIIALVVLSGYRIKKQLKQSWHGYVFIASILTILAIIIFSYVFYGNRDVLDFISLASALISIILAIVTIIYSFYTNGSSIGQAEKLQEAAKEVQIATKSYSNSAESLQKNINQILQTLSEVKEYAKDTNSKFSSIFNNFSSISSISEMSAIKEVNKDDQNNINIDSLITDYINAGSFLGNLGLLACVYSQKKDKKVSLAELNIISDNFMPAYICGYVIASSSLGIVNATIDENEIRVSSTMDGLQEKLENMINHYIAKHTDIKEQNQSIYDKIKKLFDIQ